MFRTSMIRLAVAAFAALAFAAMPSASQAASGSVRLQINKASFIVGVSGGQGVLRFARRSYPLSIAGVSVGFSAGASQANLVGTVSNIRRASDVAGTYSAATAGAALITGGKTGRDADQRKGRGAAASRRAGRPRDQPRSLRHGHQPPLIAICAGFPAQPPNEPAGASRRVFRWPVVRHDRTHGSGEGHGAARRPRLSLRQPLTAATDDAMTASNDSKPAEISRGAMIREAMKQGFFGRCPNCGKGRMFRAFLKVADQCPVCAEPLHHQRADDFPAYIVIVIVGHIVVPLVLLVETHGRGRPGCTWWSGPRRSLVMALALLQPVKGAIVALQWALGMHGFEEAAQKRDAARGMLAPAAE